MNTHVPPNDEEAEQSVVGCLLLDSDMIHQVADILTPEDFYFAGSRALFQAVTYLESVGIPVDVITVKAELERRGRFEKAGGREGIIRAMESVPSPASARHHAKMVRGKAMLRGMIEACRQTIEECQAESTDPYEAVADAEERVLAVHRESAGATTTLRDQVVPTIESISDRVDNPLASGLPLGLHDLDTLIGGAREGELLIVAARPSMGKSTLALNIAANVAKHREALADSLIFSLEVKESQLYENLLTAHTGIPSNRMRTGQLSQQEWSSLNAAAAEMRDEWAEITVCDQRGISTAELRAIARREAGRRSRSGRRLRFLIVDYLQLMRHPGAESRQNEISEISQALKNVAGDLDLTVIALSQLSRKVEERENHRPRLADLRESGSIEQDADIVAFLYREGYYAEREGRDLPPEQGPIAEAIVAKNRNGPTGTAKLYHEKECLRFRNLARQSSNPVAGAYRAS